MDNPVEFESSFDYTAKGLPQAYVKTKEPIHYQMLWQPGEIHVFKGSNATVMDYARKVAVEAGYDHDIKFEITSGDPEKVDTDPEIIFMTAGDIVESEDRKIVSNGYVRLPYKNIGFMETNLPKPEVERYTWALSDLVDAKDSESLIGFQLSDWDIDVADSLNIGRDNLTDGEFRRLLDDAEFEMRRLFEENDADQYYF